MVEKEQKDAGMVQGYVDLAVELCGVAMDNPVIPASGTFGYGREFHELYDINCLGTFSFNCRILICTYLYQSASEIRYTD